MNIIEKEMLAKSIICAYTNLVDLMKQAASSENVTAYLEFKDETFVGRYHTILDSDAVEDKLKLRISIPIK